LTFVGTGHEFTIFVFSGSVAIPASDKYLHKLTEKGRKFEWTNECQSAFEELKNQLVSSPILAHPDFSKTFILDTDASNEAIGAVLSQEIDGKERPIAFASRTLTKPERRYCATRKELLAVVFFVKLDSPVISFRFLFLIDRYFLLIYFLCFSFLYVSSMLCLIFCVFPIRIKSTLSTWDATGRFGISMLSTWTMYNRHIIGAEYLKPPCHLSFGIFEV
jgi:hypothetical protein